MNRVVCRGNDNKRRQTHRSRINRGPQPGDDSPSNEDTHTVDICSGTWSIDAPPRWFAHCSEE